MKNQELLTAIKSIVKEEFGCNNNILDKRFDNMADEVVQLHLDISKQMTDLDAKIEKVAYEAAHHTLGIYKEEMASQFKAFGERLMPLILLSENHDKQITKIEGNVKTHSYALKKQSVEIKTIYNKVFAS